MFKYIIVPLDGSRLAELALPAAAYMAKNLAAMVTLIHVIESNAPHEAHGQPHLRTAEEGELDYNLIILAIHGKSGMDAFLTGSFSHKLCSLCTTPLLLIPVENGSDSHLQ